MRIANWHEIWKETDVKRRAIDPSKICTFGIKPIDEALIGILKKDFIVIGADSGAGKSEICLQIALHNAKHGKKVALYFIEGGGEEAIYRIKWNLIRDKYYKDVRTGIEMDYRKWRMNMIPGDTLREIEMSCLDELYDKIKDNLKIYTFDASFSLEDLTSSLGYFLKPKDETMADDLLNYTYDVDLIIIDHLQYFTLINPKDELSETSAILKKINEITHHHEIPVILVSHLRKKEKDRGLPNQEDFYGTSNISKMSSVSIVLAPGTQDRNKPYTFPTYFRFVKSRTKISSNIAMLCSFDLTTGRYNDYYDVYQLKYDVPDGKSLLNHELPRWAIGARVAA
jgi:archaellum biogenesis ATPase FlaH